MILKFYEDYIFCKYIINNIYLGIPYTPNRKKLPSSFSEINE